MKREKDERAEEEIMAKVAYNACYGGFSLSREAVLLARKLSGNPAWGGPCIAGDRWREDDAEVLDQDYGHIRDVPRHDPALVRVIETLGKGANGQCADLRIAEVPSGTPYRIDEYDGNESVMTASDYEWTVAP